MKYIINLAEIDPAEEGKPFTGRIASFEERHDNFDAAYRRATDLGRSLYGGRCRIMGISVHEDEEIDVSEECLDD